MKTSCSSLLRAILFPTLIFLLSVASARANVYATDIQINGSLTGANGSTSAPVSITYHLNQTADLGVTVNILKGGMTVAALPGGTSTGLNTVSWTPTGAGTYSISITAAAADASGGSGNWTQISVDGPNTAAVYPLGMDVDKNTNSLYYGRVVVGCAADGTANGVTQQVGLYKANADGTPADEGAFGYAGYTTNDDGIIGVGEMSYIGQPYHSYSLPCIIRIAGDDRIYFVDQSGNGAIVACDMQATTNQVVICEGPGNAGTGLGGSVGYPNCPNNYANNPDGGLLNYYGEGWGQFDVSGFESGHPALYLCDTGDYPSPGVWMYHLVNGAADPNDTVGTQAVYPDDSAIYVTSAGVSVDTNLDIFVGQDRSGAGDPLARVFDFPHWHGGVLPPEGDGASRTYAVPAAEAPAWAIGSGNDLLTGINDTVLNSHLNPTWVAVAMEYGAPEANGYSGQNAGITILKAADGSVVAANLDIANIYTSAAFDNVGNVYGCSPSANYWRAWSPPGASTNTTVAPAQLIIASPFPVITKIAFTPATPGCGSVVITFTASGSPAASAFKVVASPTVKGGYTPVMGATITGSGGTYTATFSNCSTEFYQIERSGS